MSDAKKGSLGEILSASQIISADDVSAALEEQKRSGVRFGEALINLGIVTQEDIDWALSNQLDLPYIRLKKDMIDPDAIALIPASLARSCNCIPLIKAGGELNVALADPLNKVAIETLERASGCIVNVSVALIREIREMIDLWYGEEHLDTIGFTSTVFSEKALAAINADTTGGRLLDYLLLFMMQNRITSLAIQPMGDSVLFRAKKSGKVHTVGTMQPNHYPECIVRIRSAASILPTQAATQNGLITFNHQGIEIMFRVVTTQGEAGEYITLLQHKAASMPESLTDLALTADQQNAFVGMANASRGITLFASRNQQKRNRLIDLMLEQADTAGKNVLILGSGPGRLHKRFPRIPLPDGERERAHLVRDLLDHDPDVLVLEDGTDTLPFAAACRVALRGVTALVGLDLHGVGATLRQLHLWYKQQLFPPQCVNGVILCQGIELLCPDCRVPYTPSVDTVALIPPSAQQGQYYRSAGCAQCHQTGIARRIVMSDVIPFDAPFITAFEAAADGAALEHYLKQSGYRGAMQQGQELLAQGSISPDEFIAAFIL